MKPTKLKEMHYRRCKGIIRAYIARGKEKMLPTIAVKTLRTALERGQISPQNLQNMIFEVEKEAVEAFRNWHDYSDRRKRLDYLRKSLQFYIQKR
jgi:hypothetical protein